MAQVLPGTTLPLPEEAADNAFSVLTPIFAVSGGGLLLSQLTEMTGLSPTTIQNWVKRGWVSKPVNKKYGELQETAKRLGFDEIFVMTLEASPSLDDILPEIRAAGFGKVRLIPLLFGAAGHAKRDIAGDRPESVASRFRAERFEVESVVRGLGEYPEFAALYAAHLRRAAK